MKPVTLTVGLALATGLLAAFLAQGALGGPLKEPVAAPEFTHREPADWVNSPPLSLAELRGKVVLLDFWTFDCWNCYRSFPWLKALAARLEGPDFQVIGVHSPEFEREKVVDAVRGKTREFGLVHPVMVDNDFSYWQAMANRYWPAWYVIDADGQVRGIWVGETHEGDARAREIESFIRQLLQEAAASRAASR